MQRPDQLGGHNHSGPVPATAPGAGLDVVNLANLVTFARLLAVPVAVWLVLRPNPGWAFLVFALAGLSDALDGWLARHLGGSRLGAMMDPLADKALLVAMFVTLAEVGLLPPWLAAVVVLRDLVIIGGVLAMWRLGRHVVFRPLRIGKLNTALQILLAGVVLLLAGFGLHAPWQQAGVAGLTWLVAATTLVSGGIYVWMAVGER